MLASYESRRSKMYLILRETKLLQSTTKLSLIEPLLWATDCFYLRKGTFKNMSTLTDGFCLRANSPHTKILIFPPSEGLKYLLIASLVIYPSAAVPDPSLLLTKYTTSKLLGYFFFNLSSSSFNRMSFSETLPKSKVNFVVLSGSRRA